MKRLSFLVLLLAFLTVGCAHRSSPVSPLPQLVMVVSNSEQIPLKSPEISVESGDGSSDSKENLEAEEGEEEEIATIADPLEPFNRAMFYFNDKLYFWVLKPVAQGYNKVVPEAPRVGVNNFFSNLKFPIRFVSCLFQADFSCMATELGRFAVNTIWGVGGLLDPASSKQLNLPKKEAD
ncbi:MAG: VacJ family lipoprotein, partial [Deltaproteobacteria bacterium]|nr:VacJ family lipoprotein [Deltaproteobacteria bacterium]